jgi:hypothetical protein
MDVILVQKPEPMLSLVYKASVTTLLTSAIKPFKASEEIISIRVDVLVPNGRNLAAGIPYCACRMRLIRCRAKRTRKTLEGTGAARGQGVEFGPRAALSCGTLYTHVEHTVACNAGKECGNG